VSRTAGSSSESSGRPSTAFGEKATGILRTGYDRSVEEAGVARCARPLRAYELLHRDTLAQDAGI
jgi:hypothetical protein